MTRERAGAERPGTLATVAVVAALVAAVVGVTVLTRDDGSRGTAPTASPSASPSVPGARREAERIATMAPSEVAAEGVEARPPVAPPGAKDLAEAAEEAAAARPYSFVVTTFNVLGSQHSAPGGAASGFADGRVRTQWAAGLIASYGSDIVGFGEMQADQYAAMAAAAPGYTFYPGTSLGRGGRAHQRDVAERRLGVDVPDLGDHPVHGLQQADADRPAAAPRHRPGALRHERAQLPAGRPGS